MFWVGLRAGKMVRIGRGSHFPYSWNAAYCLRANHKWIGSWVKNYWGWEGCHLPIQETTFLPTLRGSHSATDSSAARRVCCESTFPLWRIRNPTGCKPQSRSDVTCVGFSTSICCWSVGPNLKFQATVPKKHKVLRGSLKLFDIEVLGFRAHLVVFLSFLLFWRRRLLPAALSAARFNTSMLDRRGLGGSVTWEPQKWRVF